MKLKDWRVEKGWTQIELAAELDVTTSSVLRWEKGDRDPDSATKRRIFILSEGRVEPNDFYDMPSWRRLLSATLSKLTGRAA